MIWENATVVLGVSLDANTPMVIKLIHSSLFSTAKAFGTTWDAYSSVNMQLTLALAFSIGLVSIKLIHGEAVNLEFSRGKCGPDKASVNVSSSFRASQEYRCASACVREPLCSLYNYNADRQLCELTKNVAKVNCDHFQNKSGFISSAVVSCFILFVDHYDTS